ncbi:CvpA family protein [Pseudodesulfovibrio sp.]|uniref:CvpA family protein n=1 Tax=unclassified Pseudodesulfovibrio TaxID=2661612 RepID=UPI003AFF7AE8
MNTLDIIILCILVIFLIRGLFRGLIQEVLSLAAVVLAVYLASGYQHLLVPYIEPYITTEMIVNGLAYAVIFIGTLIIFWLLTKLIRSMLEISMLGWIDRTAGGIFGLLEGALIGLILLMFIQSFAPDSNWLKGSYIAPRAGHLVELVGDLAPESVRKRLNLPSTKNGVDQARDALGWDDETPKD